MFFLLNGWSIWALGASVERNPFALPAGVWKIVGEGKKMGSEPVKSGQDQTPAFRVTTILISARHKLAVLNGLLKQEGDEINGYLIAEIEERSVTLVKGKHKMEVPLDSKNGYFFKSKKSNNSILGFSK
jgi:hypothetical protein